MKTFKVLIDVKIEPAAATGFLIVTKTFAEPCCDASGAICGFVNESQTIEKVRIV